MIYLLITLHAHARAGVMCSGLVSIYIYMYIYVYDQKKFEWYFSGQLTFSNADSRLLVEFIHKLYHCMLQKHFPH